MKKLLSLLSLLTISGSAVPTTIAASSYQKKETIKNSDINYQQTNNLEQKQLKRSKRQNNNNCCRTNCKDYCPETGQWTFNIQRFFLNINLPIPRSPGMSVSSWMRYIPTDEEIIRYTLLVNENMNFLNRNDLMVVSSTATSAVIKMANPAYNIYGELTVSY